MPHTSSFRCASCGAPLSVPTNLKILTCTYCGSEQEIVSEGNAVFLRNTVKAIHTSTERVASELAIVRLKQDIPQIRHRLAEAERELQRDQSNLRGVDNSLAHTTPLPEFQISRYTRFSDAKEFQQLLLGAFIIMVIVIVIFDGFLVHAGTAVTLSVVCFYGFFEGIHKYNKEVALHPQQEANRKKNLGPRRIVAEQCIEQSQAKLETIRAELNNSTAELERHIAAVQRIC